MKYKFIKSISIFIFISLISFFCNNDVLAQTCGSGTITRVVGCGQDKITGQCIEDTQTSTYSCSYSGSSCVGWASSSYCDSNCNFISQPDSQIPCGSSGGGGGSCPAECRAGSSCGVGYSAASGCSSCTINQTCCAANSCGGGTTSDGYCPAGGSIHWYTPPNYRCVTSVCSGLSREVGTCGPSDSKIYCEVGYCQMNCNANEVFTCGTPAVYSCTKSSGCPYPGIYNSGNECNPNDTTYGLCQTNCGCVSTATPPPSCTITAPTITSVNRDSATSATIKWTPGTAQTGSVQKIFISQDPLQVNGECLLATSPGCVVNVTNLSSSANSYSTGNVLAAGTLYYIRIINTPFPGCVKGSNSTNTINNGLPLPYVSSCTLTPASLTLQIGESGTVTSIVNSNSAINRVEFASSNTSAVTVTTPDSISPYTSTVTAVGPSTSTISSSVYLNIGVIACTNVAGGNGTLTGGGTDGYTGSNGGGTTNTGASTDTNGGGGGTNGSTTITSNNLSESWWQTVDSDLTSNGSLNSTIPTGEYFGLPGAGGTAGIPTYTTTTNITPSNVSGDSWITQNTNNSFPVFDYSYFENQIPSDVVFNNISSSSIPGSTFASGGTSSYGYYWYKYDGSTSGLDLTITSVANIGSRKVILLVKSADLNINSTINLNDGLGFFMTVVDKNIAVDPSVGGGVGPNLEGFFVADNNFDTGLGTNQLKIRGAVVGYDGITLSRDLGTGNLTTPGEQFEYAPDQSILFPAKLATRKLSWKEVAP